MDNEIAQHPCQHCIAWISLDRPGLLVGGYLRSLFYDLGIFAAVLSLSCYLTAGGRGLPNFSGLIAAFGCGRYQMSGV